GGSLLAVGWGAGYLKGHAVATRKGTDRVKTAVKQIETTIEEEAKLNVKAADDAAAAVPPLVPGPADRPDRDALKRLCASDPACRRDGAERRVVQGVPAPHVVD
ncbi:MAG: hypothetical protein ABL901_09090, partial [Hyphomicrobiaceae bacterium]